MTYDGKLLARARAALDVQREANHAEQQARMLRIYQEIPEMKQLDAPLRVDAGVRPQDRAENVERQDDIHHDRRECRRPLFGQDPELPEHEARDDTEINDKDLIEYVNV